MPRNYERMSGNAKGIYFSLTKSLSQLVMIHCMIHTMNTVNTMNLCHLKLKLPKKIVSKKIMCLFV